MSPIARSIVATAQIPNRVAIARARVWHLAKQQLMEPVAVSLPPGPIETVIQAVELTGTTAGMLAGWTTAARTVTVIDLTDD